MRIQLMDNVAVYVKPRKIELAREKVLSELVGELLDTGIIKESEAPYNSPIVLVPKKNGQFRMAVDYRMLNRKTLKDKYPMPDIEQCLQKLNGAQMFITLDLFSGYYQIPIHEDSQDFTAFSTPSGHYKFTRMPFGLANGCAIFQRAMNKMVMECRKREVVLVAYLDDLILSGKNEDDLLEKLETLLQIIREEGFTINLEKSHFFKENVEFLGFEVGRNGVRPGETKTKAVTDFPNPMSVHAVQQFLGLAGFFRRFVKDFSIIAAPMLKLLKKDFEFEWKQEQQDAFDEIRKRLAQRPILRLYDLNAPTELHTDASSVGIAGILLQKSSDKWYAVSYFSRKTNPTEMKYHSYELEMLA